MISIIVPVYNEEEVLPSFIVTFFKQIDLNEEYELIFVNDGSSDQTEKIIKQFQKNYSKIKLISYAPNKNLGYALPIGFKAAKGRIIVTMDSDLAHPPKIISRLVNRLDSNNDIVIGSRYVKGAGVKGVPLKSDLLSKITNFFTKLMILSQLKDVTSGFRAYRKEILKGLKTKEEGFEVELEILVKLMKKGAKISEVGFNSVDREKGESKFVLSEHGLRYIKGMVGIFGYRWF